MITGVGAPGDAFSNMMGATRQMALTAGDFDADWALRNSLVQELYADMDEMNAAVDEMTATIAANAPLAVQGAKQVLEFSKDATTEAARRNTTGSP